MKNQHGIPALFSFFVPGLGQLIKGDWDKALGVWFAYFMAFVSLIIIAKIPELAVFGFFSLLAFPIIWVWNLHDAYNN